MGHQTLGISDFFGTSDPQTLAFFKRLHKGRCLKQTVVCTHVEPGKPATHSLYFKLTSLKICAVDIGDFQFAAPGGFEVSSDIDNLLV